MKINLSMQPWITVYCCYIHFSQKSTEEQSFSGLRWIVTLHRDRFMNRAIKRLCRRIDTNEPGTDHFKLNSPLETDL